MSLVVKNHRAERELRGFRRRRAPLECGASLPDVARAPQACRVETPLDACLELTTVRLTTQ